MKTLKSFVTTNRIKMDCDYADANPNMEGSNNRNNYKCVLRMGRRQMTTPFSTGRGWTHEPDAADVLDCLASDSASIENARSFEEWASEYGYDTDSRKAEKAFKTCEQQAKKLQQFLGDDLYQELLWKTERL